MRIPSLIDSWFSTIRIKSVTLFTCHGDKNSLIEMYLDRKVNLLLENLKEN